MTTSRRTSLAAIIATILGLLLLDDVIAASLGHLGDLTAVQIAWRTAPLVVGGAALVAIAIRLKRSR